MTSSSGFGSISALSRATPIYQSTDRDVYVHPTQNPIYDSVSISSAPSGGNRFHRDLVSRLSQEVRTATTIGDIQSLRQEVASGRYTPDPMGIAARMLFMGGEA